MHEDGVGETVVGIFMRGIKCLVEYSSKKLISLCVNDSERKSTLKSPKTKIFSTSFKVSKF